jgi:trans-aconitate 2-methyltransferase
MSERYSFGTGSVAARRLHVVARVFEPSFASLLEVAGVRRVGRVLDLGCGPGSSTGSILRLVTAHEVVGLDASAEFVAEAAERLPAARFMIGDVTEPWPTDPPDLAYARFLLAHLPGPVEAAEGWRSQIAPAGALLIEEPEAIETKVDAYRRYLEVTTALVASRGATMYAGRELRGRFADASVDRPFLLDVAPADATAMFTMNLVSWRDDPWIVEHLSPGELDRLHADLASAPARSEQAVGWTLRQLALPASLPACRPASPP